MTGFYEDDIKELILNKKHVFLDKNEQSVVLFEKAIVWSKTIADCIIFSKNHGLIGVEIKTEFDTTRRLQKQLKDYSLVCDKVYTLVEDKHVEKVEKILKSNHYDHVGIITYTEFRGTPILGVYKEATAAPSKSVHMALEILWKQELQSILTSIKKQMKLGTLEADTRLRKNAIINKIIQILGPEEANKVLCDIFINENTHPDKPLKYHYFREKK